MEIIKPWIGLGIFLYLRTTINPLGYKNSNTFKYIIRTYVWNTRLFSSTIEYIIKIYAENGKNKRGSTSNIIRKPLTTGNTPNDNQNYSKGSHKSAA